MQQAVAPRWFLPELIIKQNDFIVILDDDEFIHQVWKKRFAEKQSNCHFIDFYDPKDLKAWLKDNIKINHTFLIDYEFTDNEKNGLDIIDELNLKDRAYLVTSRHEDVSVRSRAEKMGLKIIPKTFSVYIPIVFLFKTSHVKNADFIFIDDNVDLTDAWVLHGISKGKNVAPYNSINSFKVDLNYYDHITPIYIDSDLNDVMKGQEFAKELFEIGFKNIYLCTGYLATDFPKMYWIKDIIGKTPPF